MSLAMVGGRLAVAAGNFSLCLSECLLRDDSLVVILYVILRQLAGIFLGYACQYILDKSWKLHSVAISAVNIAYTIRAMKATMIFPPPI